MAYRESLDAANARIEALEHEVGVLRAAAEKVPDKKVPDTHAPTPRERELTHELAKAQHEIDDLRHEQGIRPSAGARHPIPMPTPVTMTIGGFAAVIVVLVVSVFFGR